MILAILVVYYFCLPTKLFDDPYSTVLESSTGILLSASIAEDGQWRFPQSDSVNEKFTKALLLFEDKRFFVHPGVDMRSIGRALQQNWNAGRIVSGGSTITMQVIRLSRKSKSRTIFEKIWEIILATRMEWRYSKNQILELYASHAPFGGNVVGLDAACWRYFGRDQSSLSWGEAAFLAVLPNAPSLVHPGKNRKTLLDKRNRLLDRLQTNGTIDAFTCSLAKEESIPEEPQPLPRLARHLLQKLISDGGKETRLRSTINANLQQHCEQILNDHHQRLKGNQIFNGAILVVQVNTGRTVAYVGNTAVDGQHGADVDIIQSRRSTGSILKPFLYAAMLDEGSILPRTLVADVPTIIDGFAPQNFSREYDGAVNADVALIRSLNIPYVQLLRQYRYERFHELLKNMGMTTLSASPDRYGLSLILGGAEGTLWEITGMYASMARTLDRYFQFTGSKRYARADFHPPTYSPLNSDSSVVLEPTSWLSAASIYLTAEKLKEVYRPGEESGWRYFSNARDIAWKTGTSFGFRDGWAIGFTPGYAVGVWVGNADGEGRPGLTGTDAAAPILFDVFARLKSTKWFTKPLTEMTQIATCSQSGQRLSPYCDKVDTVWVAKSGLESDACQYHQLVHLSRDNKYRVHSGCAQPQEMQHVSWFVLPAVQEYYYTRKNLFYKPLPAFRSNCALTESVASMDLIYPKENARIFIPRELDGSTGRTIFRLAHRNKTAKVYWHLDGEYQATTEGSHELMLSPEKGKHTVTLVDMNGERLEREFEVISRKEH